MHDEGGVSFVSSGKSMCTDHGRGISRDCSCNWLAGRFEGELEGGGDSTWEHVMATG